MVKNNLTLKKIDPKSASKIYAILMFFVAIIMCLFYLGIGLITGQYLLAFVGIIFLVIYPILGYIGMYIMVLIYNALAEKYGGVKLEFE